MRVARHKQAGENCSSEPLLQRPYPSVQCGAVVAEWWVQICLGSGGNLTTAAVAVWAAGKHIPMRSKGRRLFERRVDSVSLVDSKIRPCLLVLLCSSSSRRNDFCTHMPLGNATRDAQIPYDACLGAQYVVKCSGTVWYGEVALFCVPCCLGGFN